MNPLGLKNSLFTSAILQKYTKFDSYQLEDPQLVLLNPEQEQMESGIFSNILLNFSIFLQHLSNEDQKIWIGNPRIFLENILRNISYYQNQRENNAVFLNRQVENLQRDFYKSFQTRYLTNQSTKQVFFNTTVQKLSHFLELYRQKQGLSVQENQIEFKEISHLHLLSPVFSVKEKQKHSTRLAFFHQSILSRESSTFRQTGEGIHSIDFPKIFYETDPAGRNRWDLSAAENWITPIVWHNVQESKTFAKNKILRFPVEALSTRDHILYQQHSKLNSLRLFFPDQRIQGFHQTNLQNQRIQGFHQTNLQNQRIHFSLFSSVFEDLMQRQQRLYFNRQAFYAPSLFYSKRFVGQKNQQFGGKIFQKQQFTSLQNSFFSENRWLTESTLRSAVRQHFRENQQLSYGENHVVQDFDWQQTFLLRDFLGDLYNYFEPGTPSNQSYFSSFMSKQWSVKKSLATSFLRQVQSTGINLAVWIMKKLLQVSKKEKEFLEKKKTVNAFIEVPKLEQRFEEQRSVTEAVMSASVWKERFQNQRVAKDVLQKLMQAVQSIRLSEKMETTDSIAFLSHQATIWNSEIRKQIYQTMLPLETIYGKDAMRFLLDCHSVNDLKEKKETILQSASGELLKRNLNQYQSLSFQEQALHIFQNYSHRTRQILSGFNRIWQSKITVQPRELLKEADYFQKEEIPTHMVFSIWKQELLQRISHGTGIFSYKILFHQLKQRQYKNNLQNHLQETIRLFQNENVIFRWKNLFPKNFQIGAERRSQNQTDQQLSHGKERLVPAVRQFVFPEQQTVYFVDQVKDQPHSQRLSALNGAKVAKTIQLNAPNWAEPRQVVRQTVPGGSIVQTQRIRKQLSVQEETEQTVSQPLKSVDPSVQRETSRLFFNRKSAPTVFQNSVFSLWKEQRQEHFRFLQEMVNSTMPSSQAATRKEKIGQAQINTETPVVLSDFSQVEKRVDTVQERLHLAVPIGWESYFYRDRMSREESAFQKNLEALKLQVAADKAGRTFPNDSETKRGVKPFQQQRKDGKPISEKRFPFAFENGKRQENFPLLRNFQFHNREEWYHFFTQLRESQMHSAVSKPERLAEREKLLHTTNIPQQEQISQKGTSQKSSYEFPLSVYSRKELLYPFATQFSAQQRESQIHAAVSQLERLTEREKLLHTTNMLRQEWISQKGTSQKSSYEFPLSVYSRKELLHPFSTQFSTQQRESQMHIAVSQLERLTEREKLLHTTNIPQQERISQKGASQRNSYEFPLSVYSRKELLHAFSTQFSTRQRESQIQTAVSQLERLAEREKLLHTTNMLRQEWISQKGTSQKSSYEFPLSVYSRKELLHPFSTQFSTQQRESQIHAAVSQLERLTEREKLLHTTNIPRQEWISWKGNPQRISYEFPLSVYREKKEWNSPLQTLLQQFLSSPTIQMKKTGLIQPKTSQIEGMSTMIPITSASRSTSQLVNRQKSVSPQWEFPMAEAQTQLHYLNRVQRQQGNSLKQQTGALKKLERQLRQQEEQLTKLLHHQSVPEQAVPDVRQVTEQVMWEIQKQLRLERQRRGG